MITCPNCGRRNTNEARNCDNCGTALKEEQTKLGELQTSSDELAANRSSPPDSHSIQSEGGTNQDIEQSPSQPFYCSNCGEKLSGDGIFCLKCGKELKNNIENIQHASISQRKEIPMQKWEYKLVFVNGKGDELYVDGELVAKGKNLGTRARFQQLGQQGWELVAAVSESVANGGGIGTIWGGINWYFKRPQE